MYIDVNSIPEDFNAQDFMEKWKQQGYTPVVNDPTGSLVNHDITTTTGNGLWNQITTGSLSNYPVTDPLEDRLKEVEKSIELVRLENKLLRLKILSMEGKFTQEEVTNIRKMLMSEDEASKTLANTIIENA
jgi:hypothetical protein